MSFAVGIPPVGRRPAEEKEEEEDRPADQVVAVVPLVLLSSSALRARPPSSMGSCDGATAGVWEAAVAVVRGRGPVGSWGSGGARRTTAEWGGLSSVAVSSPSPCVAPHAAFSTMPNADPFRHRPASPSLEEEEECIGDGAGKRKEGRGEECTEGAASPTRPAIGDVDGAREGRLRSSWWPVVTPSRDAWE